MVASIDRLRCWVNKVVDYQDNGGGDCIVSTLQIDLFQIDYYINNNNGCTMSDWTWCYRIWRTCGWQRIVLLIGLGSWPGIFVIHQWQIVASSPTRGCINNKGSITIWTKLNSKLCLQSSLPAMSWRDIAYAAWINVGLEYRQKRYMIVHVTTWSQRCRFLMAG